VTGSAALRAGVCVWLTGLSGAGKSTIGRELAALLEALGLRPARFDGDEIRASISADLGFSKADRDANVRRVAGLARQVVSTNRPAIVALISPYRAMREEAREIVGRDRFLEVFVSTPLHVCEARDATGLYAKARSGEIVDFTGIDAPYEAPMSPQLVVDSTFSSASENATAIMQKLVDAGFLRA